MADTQIAKTILQQLGGNVFVRMTGASNLVALPDGLMFRLPGARGFCKNGINKVKITLNGNDYYNLDFARLRANVVTPVANHKDISVDNLRELFSEVTGLAVQMPRLVQS